MYHYAHIGNLRTYVFEDVLRRTLEFSGLKVRHVMNLTDVDDKTIRDSKKAGKTLSAFTSFYAKEFFKDMRKLNILPAWKYPAATGHVRDMIRLIATLLKKKIAYRAADGVYFDISKFRGYGKLSKVKQRKLKAGARVSADEYAKSEARDFALWKTAKSGEPSWKASFNSGGPASAKAMAGRPGWHIECSAMSMKYLGPTFDIHAGGIDLLFPHHEDEIAQSEAATGKPFVRYFVEGEHLMVDGKKMSKSLGNIYTLNDLVAKGFDPLDFRYFALGAHYRPPLNFTWGALKAARERRLAIVNTLERLARGARGGSLKDENEALKVVAATERQFRETLDDDLNTPKALAISSEVIHYANALIDRKLLTRRSGKILETTLYEFDRVLGLDLKRRPKLKISAAVAALVQKRETFRKAKRWQDADKIREQIKKLGYAVEDAPRGPIITPAP